MPETIKITKREANEKAEYKFEDLKPGTVFKWTNGMVSLKLGPNSNDCIHLTYSIGSNCFGISDGSVERNNKVTEVYGMIDEIIVKEIQ